MKCGTRPPAATGPSHRTPMLRTGSDEEPSSHRAGAGRLNRNCASGIFPYTVPKQESFQDLGSALSGQFDDGWNAQTCLTVNPEGSVPPEEHRQATHSTLPRAWSVGATRPFSTGRRTLRLNGQWPSDARPGCHATLVSACPCSCTLHGHRVCFSACLCLQ